MLELSKTGIEEIIRESAIDKEKKTPGLKFNHGLVPIGFRTTGSWLESGIQLSESGIPLMIRIQNPESRIQNPESRIQNPESRIQNPSSTGNKLAESIIQDRLGFPYAGRIWKPGWMIHNTPQIPWLTRLKLRICRVTPSQLTFGEGETWQVFHQTVTSIVDYVTGQKGHFLKLWVNKFSQNVFFFLNWKVLVSLLSSLYCLFFGGWGGGGEWLERWERDWGLRSIFFI